MQNNVTHIIPSNDFNVVCTNAAKEIKCGIIMGYDEKGRLCVFGGGMLDGKQPVSKDWLWIVQAFTQKLLAGGYSE